jgi:hypothetical protein
MVQEMRFWTLFQLDLQTFLALSSQAQFQPNSSWGNVHYVKLVFAGVVHDELFIFFMETQDDKITFFFIPSVQYRHKSLDFPWQQLLKAT